MLVAVREARRVEHDCVGTEHVLFGLLCDGAGLAVALLRVLGTSSESVLGYVQAPVPDDDLTTVPERFPLTPAVRRVFARADQEARQLGQTLVGPEHLLLGLLAETTCEAAHVLATFGVTFARVRGQLLQISPADKPEHLLRSGEKSVALHDSMFTAPTPKDIESLVSTSPIGAVRGTAAPSATPSRLTLVGWLWFLSMIAVEIVLLILLPPWVAIWAVPLVLVSHIAFAWGLFRYGGIRLVRNRLDSPERRRPLH